MSTIAEVLPDDDQAPAKRRGKKTDTGHVGAVTLAKKSLSNRFASLIAVLIAIMWTVPTLGLLITSFRPEADIKSTGWWTWFANPSVTLSNYEAVLFGTSSQGNLLNYLTNSLVITIPATIAPLAIAVMPRKLGSASPLNPKSISEPEETRKKAPAVQARHPARSSNLRQTPR